MISAAQAKILKKMVKHRGELETRYIPTHTKRALLKKGLIAVLTNIALYNAYYAITPDGREALENFLAR